MIPICDTVQPRRLLNSNGNRPRASAWNQEVSIKPSTIQKIHCRGRIPKKPESHGGATSIPDSTVRPVDRFWTCFRASFVTISIKFGCQKYRFYVLQVSFWVSFWPPEPKSYFMVLVRKYMNNFWGSQQNDTQILYYKIQRSLCWTFAILT